MIDISVKTDYKPAEVDKELTNIYRDDLKKVKQNVSDVDGQVSVSGDDIILEIESDGYISEEKLNRIDNKVGRLYQMSDLSDAISDSLEIKK